MTVADDIHDDADRRPLEERWPAADAVAGVGGPVRQSMADGGRESATELVETHGTGDNGADQPGASR